MAKRKGISKKTRFEVFKRDSFTCQYCGQSAPTVILVLDHMQPVSKEGTNDILNLITSCDGCNAGKSDRLLSDDSVIARQKAQLDELNERREQLEMMLEWRNSMQGIEADSIAAAINACKRLTPGYSINQSGELEVRKLVKKFGLQTVLNAIDESATYLEVDRSGDLTTESVNKAFDKLGGICRTLQQPEWKRELFYIRGIIRNRVEWYYDNAECYVWLENAYQDGVPLEKLRSIAYTVSRWDELADRLTEARKQYSG